MFFTDNTVKVVVELSWANKWSVFKTFKVDEHVVEFLNIDVPEIFNVDKHVEAPWKILIPLTNNEDNNVIELFKFGMVGGFVIAL